MARQHSGRIALVTGGSRGIGFASAERLAGEGASLILCARDKQAVEKAAERLRAGGAEVVGLTADVGDEESVNGLFEQIEERFPKLHILVNSAGIAPRVDGHKGSIETIPFEMWERTMRTNLTGTFLMCQGAVPLLKKAGWGRIITISSQAGRMFTGFSSIHYASSKAGQIGLSRVLAGELGPFNITVNCVSPTRISGEMASSFGDAEKVEAQYIARTPIGRVGKPADVAAAVAFLAGNDAGYITGGIIDVTGGFFMP
jgi:NAD(P)-dependent dehydrogenase (short-subunit alcohol dehydrogenase family)